MISLIAATDKKGVIGLEGKLPWRLPADLAYFRKITIGHPVIMGRKTFESIGYALPYRTNIVVSKKLKTDKTKNIIILKSLNMAIRFATEKYSTKEVFIIGGESVFQQAISIAKRLYITQVCGDFSGDVFFPNIDSRIWKLQKETTRKPDRKNKYKLVFKIFERTP